MDTASWVVVVPLVIALLGAVGALLAKTTDLFATRAKNASDNAARNIESAFKLINEQQEERVALRAALAEAQEQIRRLDERVAELRAEIVVLKADLNACTREIEKLRGG